MIMRFTIIKIFCSLMYGISSVGFKNICKYNKKLNHCIRPIYKFSEQCHTHKTISNRTNNIQSLSIKKNISYNLSLRDYGKSDIKSFNELKNTTHPQSKYRRIKPAEREQYMRYKLRIRKLNL